ncbi:cytochrome P450 [Mycena vulgaris]|nr:cytochrome P450 [Mycena vulgaris]
MELWPFHVRLLWIIRTEGTLGTITRVRTRLVTISPGRTVGTCPCETMFSSSTILVQSFIAFATAGIILRRLLYSARIVPLPPGPRPLPLIGNILDVPTQQPWKTYSNWSHLYGSDVISLRLPGLNLVVLNSAQAIQDLLVQRSLIYSDRPRSTMLSDLMGLSWVFGFMNYGDHWNDYRKIFHREYISDGVADARSHELMAARRLLKRLLSSKVNYEKEFRLTAGDVILSVTYGISPASEKDEFIQLAENTVGAIAEVAMGGYIVDLYPIMRKIPAWMPFTTFKRKAAQWKKLGDQMRIAPFNHAKSEMAKGSQTSSIASRIMASMHESATATEEEDVVRSVLGTAYIAGSDATVGALCSFVLAMALYPDVQKTAQHVLDTHLGGRLPDFNDYGKIPYIEALINEVLRWNPVAPMGIFHATSQEDQYQGYVIPKGSVVIPNVWAVLHNPEVYGEHPEHFIPERFLTPDGILNAAVPDTDAAFGFGRRICPGRIMARNTIWITITSVLAAFDIGDPVDKSGKPLTSDDPLEYSTSISSHPPVFNCSFNLRCGVQENVIISATD